VALACVESYRRHYSEVGPVATVVFAGMRELLEELGGDTPAGRGDGQSAGRRRALLDALGLRAFFTVVLGPRPGQRERAQGETIARALTHFAAVHSP